MIFDKLSEFFDAQAVTGNPAAKVVGSGVYDSSNVRNLGAGFPVYLVVSVDTGIVAAGAGSIRYELISDSTNALSSPTIHAVSPEFTTNTVASAANKTAAKSTAWVVTLPSGVAYEQYLGVQAVITTATISAGKINAYLTLDPPDHTVYTDQF